MEKLESKEIRLLEAGEGWACEVRLKQDDRTKKFGLRDIKFQASNADRTVKDSYEIVRDIRIFLKAVTIELQDLNSDPTPLGGEKQ